MTSTKHAFRLSFAVLLLSTFLGALQSQPLNVAVDLVVQPACQGDNNGAIFLVASGGTAPYFYAWSNLESSASIINLTPGTYSCTVTDSDMGQEIVSVDIVEPDSLIIQIDSLAVPDCKGNNGYVRVVATGGTPDPVNGYAYEWSNGSFSAVLNNIPQPGGAFTVTVTDGNNCTATATVDLNALFPPKPNLEVPPAITCANPVITLRQIPPGAAGAFSPSWSGFNGANFVGPTNTDTARVNAAGNYILTFTHNSSGCTTADTLNVNIDTLAPVVNAGMDFNLPCSNTGSALNGSVSLPGGNSTLLWNASNGGLFLVNNQESTTATTLSPTLAHVGTFVLTATNTNNGCQDRDTVVVTSTFIAPALATGSGAITCLVDSVTLQASFDTTDIRFDGWTGPGGFSSGLLAPTVGVAGNFVATITDTLTGCITSRAFTVALNNTPPPAVLPAIGPLSCQQPAVTVTANSDTLFNNSPFNYMWEGPDFLAVGRTVILFLPGVYTLTVTDTLTGCVNMATFTLNADNTFVLADAGPAQTLTCANSSLALDGTASTQQPAFVYSWSTADGNIVSGGNTLTPVVDQPGTYELLITDPVGGCSATDEVVVNEDTATPSLSANGAAITCTQATANLSAVFSPANATVAWSGPNNFSSNLPDPAVSVAGDYTVVVTNPDNGCTAEATVSVTVDTLPPDFNAVGGMINCVQSSLFIKAVPGGGGLAYSWTGPGGFTGTGDSVQVSTAGTYFVTATDNNNGCVATDSAVVTVNQNLPVANAGPDGVLNCNASSIKLNGNGSSLGPNFVYDWSTLDGNIFSGDSTLGPRVDAPGLYTLVVINITNGCSATDDVVVILRDTVSVIISNAQNVSCFGASDGLAIALAAGGSGNYDYGWSNGAQTSTAAGLGAGNYTVVVVDDEGCSAAADILITQPPRLFANASATAETFGGLNDGTATAAPSGGVPPYQYLWSNGADTSFIENLAPGDYTVTITDNNGCTVEETVNVNASNCFLTAVVSATNISCFGANDGTVNIDIDNAPPPVAITWSNGAMTAMQTGLAPGNYAVTVSDGNGCSLTRTTSITTPQPFVTGIVIDEDVFCPDSDNGFLAASASGGTQPYNYQWSNGVTTALNPNLTIGSYSVTITDANGCSEILSAEITATDDIPPVLFVQDAIVSLDTNGIATVFPETFIQASIDLGCEIAGFTVTPNTFDCDQLGPQQVVITATDLNGNIAVDTAQVVVIDNAFPIISCPSDVTLGLCDAFITYPTPTVSDNCTVDPGLLVQESGLPSGSLFPVGVTIQSFSYTDAFGNKGICNWTVNILDLPDIVENITPAGCAADCSGSATLNFTGGVPPFSIEWSTGQSGLTADSLCPGSYGYTVTDGADCVTIFSLNVGENDTQAPVLALQLAVAPLGADGSVVLDPQIFDAGTTDNCGIASWSVSPDVFTCADAGTRTVVVTVTDFNGNVSTGMVDVVVTDTLDPMLTCPQNIVASFCNNVVFFPNPTFTDNCAAAPNTLELVSGLAPGSIFPVGATLQTFRATDVTGNSATCSFLVQVFPKPTISAITDEISCNGVCDGGATLSLAGGFAPLTVEWSNGQTGLVGSGLCAGVVTATITDGAGCTLEYNVVLDQPDSIDIFVDNIVDDIDNAGLGSIDVTVSGGTMPYTYSWTRNNLPFATTQDLSGLQMGAYILRVTDFNGCVVFSDTLIVDNTVGTGAPEWADGLRVYPNPVNQFLRIEFPQGTEQELEVSLIDASGRSFRKENFSGYLRYISLDTSDLPAGFWLLCVRNTAGQTVTRKLVKQ